MRDAPRSIPGPEPVRPHPRPLDNRLGGFVDRNWATLSAVVIAAVILVMTLFGHVDLVQLDERLVRHIEGTAVDDVVVAILLVVVGTAVDSYRLTRRVRNQFLMDEARRRVFTATMVTVQDLVNNALMNLQLVRLEAEDTLSPATLALFDNIIENTARQLKVLGDLEILTERPMAMGMGIETETNAP